jgi:ABC-type multidrug transport system fused ATPase/permease subunit
MTGTSIWRKAWALLTPHERRTALFVLVVIFFGSISAAVMVGSVLPFLTVIARPQMVADNRYLHGAYVAFGFQSTYAFLIALGLLSLAIIIIANLLQAAKLYVIERFAEMRVHALSQRLLATFMRQPYEFYLNRHTGDMTKGILQEAGEVSNRFYRPAADLISSTLTVLSVAILLLIFSPVVAFGCFGVIGGLYAILYLFSRRISTRLGTRRTIADSLRFRYANEAFGGIKDIKILGRENFYLNRYTAPSYESSKTKVYASLIWSMPYFILQIVAFGGIIAVCLVMIDRNAVASGGALGSLLPTLGLFAFAGQRLMPEVQKIYASLAILRYSERAIDLYYRDSALEAQAVVIPEEMPAPLGLKDHLLIDNVHYAFPNTEVQVLNGITLKIARGEKIGIVGTTGAGKTTLADVVLGLLRPATGQLVLDGKPITDDMVRAWQQSIGYVPQSIFLADATIAENIAMGITRAEIDQERLIKAAKLAQVHDFIVGELPLGYETEAGEKGVRLSGGQRQRIGIARALYHDADFIVFDEATSALDNLTERDLIRAVEALPGDKTLMMIAHRLSTVKVCDRIVVLDKGRIVAIGPWDQILAENDQFRELVQSA